MKIKFLILLLFVFISCNDDPKNNKITGQSFKFWTLVKERKYKTFYYFDTAGKWLVFNRYADNSFEPYESGDAILINKWQFLNDTIIDIGGLKYKIEKLTNDSLEIIDLTWNNRKKFISTVDSLIPREFRKLH